MHPWRFRALAAFLVAATGALAWHVAQIQVQQGERYLAQAQEERFGRQTIPGRRGAILDRNGQPLAVSIDTYDVYIQRKVWQDPRKAQEGAQALSTPLRLAPDEILARAAEGPAEVPVARDVDEATGKAIAALRPAGVRLIPSSRRHYPEGSLAGPLLGFLGRDKVGLTGLEADLEELLRGEPGFLTYQRDGSGAALPLESPQGAAPRSGADVILTIDRFLQKTAEEELAKAVRDSKAQRGDIIVMGARTGEVLAMASYPSFDPGNPNPDGEGRMALLKNRAVTDVYEPGSVFKLITASGALNEGLVTANSTYVDAGRVVVGGWPIFNWNLSANGVQTVTDVLVKSLNTGAVWLAQLLGPQRFYSYVEAFGFGRSTGIGLGGEGQGHYRPPAEPGWSQSDLAANSFGQGIGVTPLQMATAVAAIANGGQLMRPYVVKEVVGPQGSPTKSAISWAPPQGRKLSEPQVVRQVIKPQTARVMAEIMTTAIESRPWHPAQVPRYTVAGKTGTANIPTGGRYDNTRFIASFAGFAPAQDPRLVVLVKVDEPKGEPWGSTVAAPAFGRLMQQGLAYLKVAPQKPLLVQRP